MAGVGLADGLADLANLPEGSYCRFVTLGAINAEDYDGFVCSMNPAVMASVGLIGGGIAIVLALILVKLVRPAATRGATAVTS